jgi:UDP-glucose 4-epimerase
LKALITGGAGFIGSHLAEFLLAAEHQVTIIDDLSTGRFENIAHLVGQPGFHYAIETITNEVVMDRLVSECDMIFHLAAAVGVELIVHSPVRVIETNILGTEAVLRAAHRYRKKTLIASTSEIYGKSDKVPFSEDDDRVLGATTKARWSYSTSKAVDEFLALAYYKERGLPTVIFRLFNTVGPRQTGQYGMVVPRFVKNALVSQPIRVYGDGRQSRCFAHVKDVVRAIAALAEHPGAIGQVFNIGTTEEVTIAELAQRAKQAAGSNSEIVYVPYAQAYEEGFEDMRRRLPDISKIKQLIGWKPSLNLDDVLKDVIAYMQTRQQEAT